MELKIIEICGLTQDDNILSFNIMIIIIIKYANFNTVARMHNSINYPTPMDNCVEYIILYLK